MRGGWGRGDPGAPLGLALPALPALAAEPSRARTRRKRASADGQRAARERGKKSFSPTCWHPLPTTLNLARECGRAHGAGSGEPQLTLRRPRGGPGVWLPYRPTLDPCGTEGGLQDPSEPGRGRAGKRPGRGRRGPRNRARRAPRSARGPAREEQVLARTLQGPAGLIAPPPGQSARSRAPGQTHPCSTYSRVIDPAAQVSVRAGLDRGLPPAPPRARARARPGAPGGAPTAGWQGGTGRERAGRFPGGGASRAGRPAEAPAGPRRPAGTHGRGPTPGRSGRVRSGSI